MTGVLEVILDIRREMLKEGKRANTIQLPYHWEELLKAAILDLKGFWSVVSPSGKIFRDETFPNGNQGTMLLGYQIEYGDVEKPVLIYN